MKHWLTKAIAFLFVFALGAQLFLMPSQVYAQDATPVQEVDVGGTALTADSIQAAINSPTPNLANTTAYVFYTISILLTGTFDPTYDPAANTGTPEAPPTSGSALPHPSTLAQSLERDGVIGGVAFLTAEMYKKQPASAQVYFADLIQNSRLTGTPAYAQGVGFGALNPILGTWKAFRDVAYYLLTIMFIVTGFLILVRHKISGNVAVTVQNALPKLVITLILITFSYAIAGLVVDAMFLTLYFIINIFSGQIFDGPIQLSAIVGGEKSLTDLAFNTHIFEFTIGYVFNTGNASAWGAASAVGDIVYSALTSSLSQDIFGEGTILKTLFGTLINAMFTIILGVALLIAMFRTFFSLVMSYAGFVINVVLSPFILLAGAIPGQDPWKNWIKNLIGGLAPFVVVVFMIFMSLALTGASTVDGIGYDPDALNNQAGLRLPLILGGNINAGSFIGVLAMGFMLLMPEAVKMTKKIVGASGGIFDEFKDAAVGNLKKGWTGDKNLPFIPSGKSLLTSSGTSAIGGAGIGYYGGRKMARNTGPVGRFAGGAIGATMGGIVGGAGGIGKELVLDPYAKIKETAMKANKPAEGLRSLERRGNAANSLAQASKLTETTTARTEDTTTPTPPTRTPSNKSAM